MNVLIVTESLDVNNSSGAKCNLAMIHSFVKAGYKLEVVHYSHKQITIDGVHCVWAKERKWNFGFLLSRIQRKLYSWFGINIGHAVDALFGSSFGFYNDANSISKAVSAYQPNQFDMVWTLSNGNSYRAHRAVLKHSVWHNKWYAYVHDPYPQQLYPRPYNYVPYGFKQKRRFLEVVTKAAKRVVFPSLLLKEWMQSYYVQIKEKSLIVPHQLNGVVSLKSEVPPSFDTTKFNILHAGNLLDLRDPKRVIDAFTHFLKEHPEAQEEARLTFVGKKSSFDDYLQAMSEQYPQIYVSDDYVPFQQVFAMQQYTNINVILEAISEISPFLPGKFPHCVSANKPIIAITPYYSETKRLLGENYNYIFDFKDVDGLANAVHTLYQQWKLQTETLTLNRPDLQHYLSSDYLKEVIVNDQTV